MTDDYCIDLIMGIAIADCEENGMLHLMNVVYFDNGEPYLSYLMGSHVSTNKCDWSEPDKAAFLEWINSDQMQQGFV